MWTPENGRCRVRLAVPGELRVLAITLTAVLLYLYLRPLVTLVVLFALGTLLAAALHRPFTWLQERLRLGRGATAAIVVVGLAAATLSALWWVMPVLLGQAVELGQALPGTYDALGDALLRLARRNPALAEYAREQAARVDTQALVAQLLVRVGSLGAALGGAALAGLLVVVVALYSLIYPLPLVSGLLILWPPSERERVAHSVNASLHKVGAWAGGMLIAMLAVGLLSTLALWLLGVRFALLFGVVAALLEVVPTLGPILAAIPPMVMAFFQEPIDALWVALAFFVVQQIENHVLVPLIFAGTLRMHPMLILFAVLVMGTLFGLLGVFLSIPLLAVVQAVVQEFARAPAAAEREAAEEQARDALEMPRRAA